MATKATERCFFTLPNCQDKFYAEQKYFHLIQEFSIPWLWGKDKVRRAFISEAVNFKEDTAAWDKQFHGDKQF